MARRRHAPVPRRKGQRLRSRLARPGNHVVAGAYPGGRAVRRDDVAHRLLGDAGRDGRPHSAPPHGEWKDNAGKPIYFDSIDNSAYILGKAPHSTRRSWIYIDGESFNAI